MSFSRLLSSVSSVLQQTFMSTQRWDELFEKLNAPEEITVAWIGANSTLELQLMVLVGTVQNLERSHPDAEAPIPVDVANNFDRAIFCIGQLVATQPEAVADLRCAAQLVGALGAGLRYGWSVHPGIGKFSANSLVVLATCVEARPPLRAAACRVLLREMVRWLHDRRPPTNREQQIALQGGAVAGPAVAGRGGGGGGGGGARVERNDDGEDAGGDDAGEGGGGGWLEQHDDEPGEQHGGPHGGGAEGEGGGEEAEVCGCSCTRPSTSATCWVERLLATQDALLDDEVLRMGCEPPAAAEAAA